MGVDDQLVTLLTFVEKTFKTDEDIEPLRRFVENELELSTITDLTVRILERVDAGEIFGLLFLGLSQNSITSQEKCFKLIDTIVKCTKTYDPTKDHNPCVSNDTLTKIIPELGKLKPVYLVKLCDRCLQMMRNAEEYSLNFSWSILIPKIIDSLDDKKCVPYAGSEISGIEYRREIIETMYTVNIGYSQATAIHFASMFSEIQLTNTERERIVTKLCCLLETVDAKKLPIFVQHLLRLSKNENIIFVFYYLRKYFDEHRSSDGDDDGNSPNFNKTKKTVEDRSNDMTEAQNAVLCNIEEFARIYRLNEFLKFCKNASNASAVLLDPFLLSVLLVLSSVPAYEAQILDILRLMILHAIDEQERKKSSAWLTRIIDTRFDIDELFSKTIRSGLCENEKVTRALANLAFILLSVSGIKIKESTLKRVWRLGRIILVSLLKKHKKMTKWILQNLADRIITGCISQQYTDCLLHLCNVASVTIVDNFNVVSRILEFITSMPGAVSQRIISALIPLVQISAVLRDNLIQYLRKALYSRNEEIRQTAVLGFLQLLKFLKLQRVSTYSQNTLTQTTFQGASVFTQICMDVHTQQTMSQQFKPAVSTNVNEALCLEVVGILKRCFLQQASVKTTLYKGLFAAINVNSQLCTLVLDVLLDHFNQYLENDSETLPPLSFDKIVVVRAGNVTLHEPIGELVLLIQDILTKIGPAAVAAAIENERIGSQDMNENEEATRSVTKFALIMRSLVDKFSKCDLYIFKLDESGTKSTLNSTLLVTTSNEDNVKTRHLITQILSVYEALMAYVVNSWTPSTSSHFVSKLVALHQVYHSIVNYAKNMEKTTSKKKEKDLSKMDAENSEQNIDDNDRTKDTIMDNRKDATKCNKPFGRNATAAISNAKKTIFVVPRTILGLRTICRLLNVFLLEKLEWSNEDAIREVKTKPRVFHYAMQSALEAIRITKSRLNEEQRSSAVFKDVTSLAILIFARCLSRYDQVSQEFDARSASIGVECFTEIISLMQTHYHSKFAQFLEETEADKGLPKQLLPVLKVYKELFVTLLSSSSEDTDEQTATDPARESLTSIVIEAISVIVLALPIEHDITAKVFEWLLSIAEKYYLPSLNNCKAFVKVLFTMHDRCRVDLTVMDSVCSQMGHLFPSINQTIREKNRVRPLMMITESSKYAVLPMTCSALISYLDNAEYVITRFKSEYIIVNSYQRFSSPDEENALTQCDVLKRRERELCQHITHITLMTQVLINIAAPTGPCLESLTKFLTRTFSILTALTKYFISRSTSAEPVYQNALFHKLVKIAGSQFIRSEASELILYIEKDYENESKKSLSHLNNQAKKQQASLPKLVSELESFPKAVLQLSKKCKDTSLSTHVKLTITRDFRLNAKKVDELISRQNAEDRSESEDETVNVTVVGTSQRSSQPPSQYHQSSTQRSRVEQRSQKK